MSCAFATVGSIAVGKPANLIAVDAQGKLVASFHNGQIAEA
jgi:cytosine/adenosine deaminase-related metal-dependent hydrolase